MQSLDSTQKSSSRPQTTHSNAYKIGIAIMAVVLLVAIVFAANQNDVIGWLVVIISGGWLLLAIATVLMVRRGAQAVNRQAANFNASLAAQTQQPESGRDAGLDEMFNTKLDHSFKIVEVQKRVITQELEKGAEADHEMIGRALETIEMTASNARDMINPDRHSRTKQGSSATEADSGNTNTSSNGDAISGEVIN